MVIKTSPQAEVKRLVGQLGDENAVRHEAAVARLIVLGARAVPSLLRTAGDATQPARARAAAFQALEAIGDRRALEPALAAARSTDRGALVAVAAVGVLRAHLASRVGPDADRAFEGLTDVAFEAGREDQVRLAAVAALKELSSQVRDAVRTRLATDPSPKVRASVAGPADLDDIQAEPPGTSGHDLPTTPGAIRDLLAARGASMPLPTLHRLVVAIRDRESAAPAETRPAWEVARAAVHQVLAARRSSVALYDLRETLAEARQPLSVGFLAALDGLGDASCLEPIAAAYARSTGPQEDWWRSRLASAFQQIVRRDRLTRRHRSVRRALSRWPDVTEALLPRRGR